LGWKRWRHALQYRRKILRRDTNSDADCDGKPDTNVYIYPYSVSDSKSYSDGHCNLYSDSHTNGNTAHGD
jgi:hypothetical protein